jgi:hypothetical protein
MPKPALGGDCRLYLRPRPGQPDGSHPSHPLEGDPMPLKPLVLIMLASVAFSSEISDRWIASKDIALIDINVNEKAGKSLYFYLNSKGDVTIRQGEKETRAKVKNLKDKTIVAFIDYLYGLKEQKDGAGDNTVHVQRRIGAEKEMLFMKYADLEEIGRLSKQIEAVAALAK